MKKLVQLRATTVLLVPFSKSVTEIEVRKVDRFGTKCRVFFPSSGPLSISIRRFLELGATEKACIPVR